MAEPLTEHLDKTGLARLPGREKVAARSKSLAQKAVQSGKGAVRRNG